MRRAALLFGLTLALACAPDAADRAAARAEVERFARAHHAAFARGDFAAWAGMLAPDGLLIAADPYEALVGRDSIAAEMHRDFGPALAQGLAIAIEPRWLRIGLTRRADAAWVADVLEYRIAFGGDTLTVPIRFMAVAEKDTGVWRYHVITYSRPLDGEDAFRLAAADSLPAPDPVPGGMGREGREVARLFRRAVGDTNRWMRQLSRRGTVLAIGPGDGQTADGPDAVRAMFRVDFARFGPLRERQGGVRTGRAGRLTWLATNVERAREIGGRRVTVAYRVLAVYEERGESERMVGAHLSNGIADPE